MVGTEGSQDNLTNTILLVGGGEHQGGKGIGGVVVVEVVVADGGRGRTEAAADSVERIGPVTSAGS